MIEVLKQSLEALELALRSHGVMLLSDPPQDAWKTYGVEGNARQAITSLRQAIKELESQEPVAHWSDCAVHSEPAYPKSECDCGGIVAVADYTALSDKYVALSDKYVALKAQHKEQEPVAWLLTDKNINSLQVDSIQRLINRLNHAHHTDLCVRINGQDEWFEADWLKHMVRVTPPAQTQRTWVGLTDDEIDDFGYPHFVTNQLPSLRLVVRYLEAKLKEKNHG
jgi:hypothetical protein